MPELSSDAAPSSTSRPSTRRRVARRYLTGLSAAGLTAALALTVAVGDAAASPAAKPPARVVTLTSSSSSPTGNLTVQVKYQLEPRGRNKVLSVTFSGGSKISLKHPALIMSLRPMVPLPLVHRQVHCQKIGTHRRCSIRVIAFVTILKIHNQRHFSGALPAKALAQIGKIFAMPPRLIMPGGYVLSATFASVIRHKRQISVDTMLAGLRVGVLLGASLP